MSSRGTRRAVTLRDVANQVGVSVSAVSMALADHPRISTAAKQEIRAAASELGYVTNSAGRALRAQRSGTLALIIPDSGRHVFGHAYFMHLLVGVSAVVNSSPGASLLLSTEADERDGVSAYERVLRSGAADGAIIASAAVDDPNVARMVSAGLPVVVVGRFPHLPQAVSVGVDDVGGASAATDHLLTGHGVRRVGHITGPLGHQAGIDRLDGYRRAFAAAGLPVREQWVVEGDFSEESGGPAVARLLQADPGLDAVFVANDEMAYGAMLELRRQGRRVPEDVALVGYDDFGVARLVSPGLTTITVPAAEVGRRATTCLLALLANPELPPVHEVLPVQLTVRQSCGCPPS